MKFANFCAKNALNLFNKKTAVLLSTYYLHKNYTQK